MIAILPANALPSCLLDVATSRPEGTRRSGSCACDIAFILLKDLRQGQPNHTPLFKGPPHVDAPSCTIQCLLPSTSSQSKSGKPLLPVLVHELLTVLVQSTGLKVPQCTGLPAAAPALRSTSTATAPAACPGRPGCSAQACEGGSTKRQVRIRL